MYLLVHQLTGPDNNYTGHLPHSLRGIKSMTYYDDNFGHWNINGDESETFYRHVQGNSNRKECRGCGNTVSLLPQYAYCNSCADKIERGIDICY